MAHEVFNILLWNSEYDFLAVEFWINTCLIMEKLVVICLNLGNIVI